MPGTGTPNKVTFGIKNVHYAIMQDDKTFDTPIPYPGATGMTNEPKGEMTEFFADDIAYFQDSTNQGYSGTFSCANVPDHFLINVMGYRMDDNGVLHEDVNAKTKKIAWLFEFDGDQKAVRRCMPNVTVSRTGFGSSTKTTTKEPNTVELAYVAAPDERGIPQYKTTETTSPEVYNDWYKQVYTAYYESVEGA